MTPEELNELRTKNMLAIFAKHEAMTDEEKAQAAVESLDPEFRRWELLKLWLREARGRDYVTRTPAVVLQKMADLEEQP